MKILVTGAAGFIGFHLVERLIKEGCSIIGIDNVNDYYDVSLKYARLKESGINIEHITENGNLVSSEKYEKYRFAKIDITDLPRLEKLFLREEFTHVVNLAAQAGVRYSIENPHAYIQSNVVGFMNVLECCRHNKIKHLVYASSSSVYGANAKVPFSENDQVDNPVSLYAATKKSNELMAHTYSHLYGLPTAGLRFFTVYGPWGRPDMAPMLFANAITKGEPIKVFNRGDMERDFTYIDDIVEGVTCLLQKVNVDKDGLAKPKDKKLTIPYEVYNIGNGSPINLLSFIKTMEKKIGRNVEMIMMPMQDGDVKQTWADTSKLEKVSDYTNTVQVKEGINRFIDWFQNYSR